MNEKQEKQVIKTSIEEVLDSFSDGTAKTQSSIIEILEEILDEMIDNQQHQLDLLSRI